MSFPQEFSSYLLDIIRIQFFHELLLIAVKTTEYEFFFNLNQELIPPDWKFIDCLFHGLVYNFFQRWHWNNLGHETVC